MNESEMLNEILDKLRTFARAHYLRMWVEVTNEEDHYFMFTHYGKNDECCEYMIVPKEIECVTDVVNAVIEDITEKLLSKPVADYVM